MIEITVTRNRVTARGHASDGAGCAAVSAILYALAGGLENLGVPFCWSITSGEAEIEIPRVSGAGPMLLMAAVGLRQVAAARTDVAIACARVTRLRGGRPCAGGARGTRPSGLPFSAAAGMGAPPSRRHSARPAKRTAGRAAGCEDG